MLKKSQVLKEGRRQGLLEAMRIIKKKLVLETPIFDEELNKSYQAKDNVTQEDIVRYVFDYIKKNGW